MEKLKSVFKSGIHSTKEKITKHDIKKERILTEEYLNLLALNIDSFTGGTKGIW